MMEVITAYIHMLIMVHMHMVFMLVRVMLRAELMEFMDMDILPVDLIMGVIFPEGFIPHQSELDPMHQRT